MILLLWFLNRYHSKRKKINSETQINYLSLLDRRQSMIVVRNDKKNYNNNILYMIIRDLKS